MKLWTIADTHFYDELHLLMTRSFFGYLENMNDYMIHRWNEVVSDEDTIIHVGDFCVPEKEKVREIINRVKGRVILVKGNHDKLCNEEYLSAGISEVYDGEWMYGEKYLFSHVPVEYEYEGIINVHGHYHWGADGEGGSFGDSWLNVAADMWGFQPVRL